MLFRSVRRSPSDVASLHAVSGLGLRGKLRAFALAPLAALLLASTVGPAHTQTVTPDLAITNGQVIIQALRDSVLYLGGSFSFVGPVTGAGVPVDSATALPTANFPIVNGIVLTAIPDGTGGWFIGGQFTAVGAQPRANIARVLADGSISPWNPGATAAVRALLLVGNTLHVGGDFLTLGGVARNRVGALDASTGVTTAWNPDANASVRALGASPTQIYIGGQFTTIGGQLRNRIAAVNTTTGGVVAGWDPNANNTVLCMVVDNVAGVVYIGGQFTFCNGVTRNRVAAIETATGLVTDFNVGSNNSVFALVATPSTLYVGGQFTIIGGQPRNRLAALSTLTGLALPWNPNANNIVQALKIGRAHV